MIQMHLRVGCPLPVKAALADFNSARAIERTIRVKRGRFLSLKFQPTSPCHSSSSISSHSKKEKPPFFISLKMTGFWFHLFCLPRLRLHIIKGRGLRARLARQRMVNRRVMQSVITSQVAAEQMEEQHQRIREAMDLRRVANALDDLWVLDCLFEVENDPLMRTAFQRINSQNPGTRNTPSTFTGGRRRRPSLP
ncbi:hypothetical protein GQ457_02G031650 [Hibiscus cannabinus]